jgi:hypothetical protein
LVGDFFAISARVTETTRPILLPVAIPWLGKGGWNPVTPLPSTRIAHATWVPSTRFAEKCEFDFDCCYLDSVRRDLLRLLQCLYPQGVSSD